MSYTDLKIEDKIFVSFAAFMDLLTLCSQETHYLSQLRDFQYVSTFTNGGFAGEQNGEFYDLLLFRSNGFPKLKVSLSLDASEGLDVSFWTYKRGVPSEETNLVLSDSFHYSYGDWSKDKLLTYLRAFEKVESEDLILSFGVGLGSEGIFLKLAKALGFDMDFINREVSSISKVLISYNKEFLSAINKGS